MDIDQQLQAQSKLLLQKLKARQGKLQNSLKNQSNTSKTSEEDSRELETSTTALKQSLIQSAKARERLAKYKVSSHENGHQPVLETIKCNGDLNTDKTYSKTEMKDKSVLYKKSLVSGTTDNNFTSENDVSLDESEDTPLKAFVTATETTPKSSKVLRGSENTNKPETPNTVRRRKIIDKNVKVDSNLNESELFRDDSSGLNFSYSKFNESDLEYLHSKLQASPEEVLGTGKEKFDGAISDEETDFKIRYKSRLVDAGNDRKVAAVAREAVKPKSILASNGPSQLKKNLSKVSFLTSKDGSISRESFGKMHDRHLLGYDWISGLLDNDRDAMDHSEGYFEELREFRRINRQECCNDFYNRSPESLFELKEREPSPIDEALSDTKVKPYQVNDRLFTEPIKDHLFPGQDEVDDIPYYKKSKKPTHEEPRFVRVSIPRSTLMSPHHVKPQRRSQYEPSDSFALSKHCVMGYESSVPSMLPAASNIGLKDASKGVKSKLQTTLADAERMATSYPFPYSSSMSSVRHPTKENTELYKSYMDMTMPSNMRSNIPGVGDESVALKKATEDLLNSTYSMMYELDQIKQERQYKDSRNLGRVA